MLKYGKNIHFNPDLLHPKNIDRQTIELIPKYSNVLEIGCATGFMGEYLKNVKKCKVTGVEMRTDEAKVARKKLTRLIFGNIEDVSTLKLISEKYDVVLVSALIQHLRDPWEALKQWKRFIEENGFLLITASNIAHWSLRLQLLQGKFDYTDFGLLDNTHLRFFTINSFKDLVSRSGYTIEYFSIDPVGGGIPKISNFLSHFFPGLFAYQMLIKARPRR